MFLDRNGNATRYPVVNNYDVAKYDPVYDDGKWARLPVNVQFTVTKLLYKIRFKISGDAGGYVSFGVRIKNTGGKNFWVQCETLSSTAFILRVNNGSGYVDLVNLSNDVWYTLTLSCDENSLVFTVNGNSVTLTNPYSELTPENIWIDGSTYGLVDGYFDYMSLQLNTDEEESDYINILRGDGYARKILEEYPYSPPLTLYDSDELRFDNYLTEGNYAKFSTDGFYIVQEDTSIKVKGTDSSERTYALTDGVWYNIRAKFYRLVGKYAMKVSVYLNGAKVCEFNPVYSSLDEALENPLFSSISGKSGLIDNVEVYR